MTWAEFSERYARQIAAMARIMLGRWRVPLAVTCADVEQEILLGAWLAWERWVPGRGGMKREAFALCSGRLAAQGWLNKQRNALRRSGKAHGRFPLAETTLGPEGCPECAVEPGQEVAVLFDEALREALVACRNQQELHALRVWGSAGVEGASPLGVEVVTRVWRRKVVEA